METAGEGASPRTRYFYTGGRLRRRSYPQDDAVQDQPPAGAEPGSRACPRGIRQVFPGTLAASGFFGAQVDQHDAEGFGGVAHEVVSRGVVLGGSDHSTNFGAACEWRCYDCLADVAGRARMGQSQKQNWGDK